MRAHPCSGHSSSSVSPAPHGQHGLGYWHRGFYRAPVTWVSRPARLVRIVAAGEGPNPLGRLAFVLPVCPLACQLGHSDGRKPLLGGSSRPLLRVLHRRLEAERRANCERQIIGFPLGRLWCKSRGSRKGLRGLALTDPVSEAAGSRKPSVSPSLYYTRTAQEHPTEKWVS